MDKNTNIKLRKPRALSTKHYLLCEPYMAIRYGLQAGMVWAALVDLSNERDMGTGFKISYEELAIKTATVGYSACKRLCRLFCADGWLEDKRANLYYPEYRIARIPPKVSRDLNDKRLTKPGKFGKGNYKSNGAYSHKRQKKLDNLVKQIKEDEE